MSRAAVDHGAAFRINMRMDRIRLRDELRQGRTISTLRVRECLKKYHRNRLMRTQCFGRLVRGRLHYDTRCPVTLLDLHDRLDVPIRVLCHLDALSGFLATSYDFPRNHPGSDAGGVHGRDVTADFSLPLAHDAHVGLAIRPQRRPVVVHN